MSAITLRHSIAVLLAPTLITPVLANDTADVPVVEFDPLIITVSKSEQKLSTAPARVTVITDEAIEKNPLQNLSKVIEQDAGIAIKQSGGVGQIAEVYMRGTRPNHTLFLKDGARLNSQNHLAPLYPAFFDLTDVDSVEITKGAGSVQYGADAVAGVVQMRERRPSKSGIELTGIGGENNTYKAIVKANLVSDTGFYATAHGQRLETDGTRVLDNQSRDAKVGYEQKGYGVKLGYQAGRVDTSLQLSQNEGVSEFYNYLTGDNDATRTFENQLINAKIGYNITDDLTLSARYSQFKDAQDVKDSDPDHFNTENEEAEINAKWQFTPSQNILAGVSYLDAQFESGDVADGKKSNDSKGYYLQHQYNSESINTQVGLRVEDNERFGTHTVGQGAIRYHFTPKSSVYANVGSAFRAPALTELYYFSQSPWGNTYGNPDLQPEESLSYEIGADTLIGNHTKAYISAYRTNIDNLIEYQYGSPDSTYVNVDEAKFTGGELGLKWTKNDLYLGAEYGYVKTENKATGLELAYRPKQTFTLSAGVANNTHGANVSLVARNKAYINGTNTAQVGGYVTVDVGGYWNITPNVKLFGNIENIGDVEYKQVDNFGNGWYVNGGRFASAGVTLRY